MKEDTDSGQAQRRNGTRKGKTTKKHNASSRRKK